MKVKSESEVAQSCPTLSDPMDCSVPGSSIRGFFRQEYWSGVPLPSPDLIISTFKRYWRDFPGDLVVRTLSFHCQGLGLSCGELRSCKPHGVVKKIFLNKIKDSVVAVVVQSLSRV